MEKKYSVALLNKMIMGKRVDEFFFAVLQIKHDLDFTDEECLSIISQIKSISPESKSYLSYVVNSLQESGITDLMEIAKIILRSAQMNKVGVLVSIDDQIYNVLKCEFVDFEREKVVRFEPAGNYYNEYNAGPVIFTKNENPDLDQPRAFFYSDDSYLMQKYIKLADEPYDEEIDLTESFLKSIEECNGNSRINVIDN